MPTLEEIQTVEEQLKAGTISVQEAGDTIFAKRKGWRNHIWKRQRDDHLNQECDSCESVRHQSDKTFYLFNRDSEPYNVLKDRAFKRIKRQALKRGEIPPVPDKRVHRAFKDYQYERESCPSCFAGAIRKRKTKQPLYACRTCHHTFDEPISVKVNANNQSMPTFKDMKERLIPTHYKEYVWQHYGDDIRREALLNHVESLQAYIKFRNVTTLCYDCAVQSGFIKSE